MTKQFVLVSADVDCEWKGLNPVYRVYVDDELFVERTWNWTEHYLHEILQIEADPGEYSLRWELVPPHLAQLVVQNLKVEHGPGKIVTGYTLRIRP